MVIVAPINALLNWLLGERTLRRVLIKAHNQTVWGPDSVRLGFIGAPIATAISLNLTSILYTFYGLWFTSKVAWHPVSKECLHDLHRLFRLGSAGVAQIAAEVSSNAGRNTSRTKIPPVVVVGARWAGCQPNWHPRTRCPVRLVSFRVDVVSSTIRTQCCRVGQVGHSQLS